MEKTDRITEMVRKILLAGLGAAAITKEKAGEIAQDLIKKGEIARKDLETFAREIKEKSGEGKEVVDKLIAGTKGFLQKANLSTKKEVDALRQEIEELKKQLSKSKKKK